MRVIAGIYGSRPLLAPAGVHTRPTADRLRETLFNVLTSGAANRIAGCSFLDLYAGSGAIGIEAISRGAACVTFVEQAPPAIAILTKNLANLNIKTGPSAHARVEKRSVRKFLQGLVDKPCGLFDAVFLDPPYEEAEEYATALNLLGKNTASLLAPTALVIAEHRRKSPLAESYSQLSRVRVLEQGDAALSFYQVREEVQSASNGSVHRA